MYPPAMMGRDEPIDRALEISPDLREAYEREPEAKEIIETARALEGLRREDSVHAAGVVIGDAPLVEYLPLKLTKDSREGSKKMVTQFDMNGVAQLGLLKMDFLGLRTLSVIEETLRHLRSRGIELDIDHIPLDDAETYAMLRRGETTGVFQMESPGMRTLIKLLEPDRFEDLMALVALYRPGPLNTGMHTEFAERKHGRRKVVYPHPALEPVLKDTYGVMVYQEKIMQIAVQMAGYSMGQADTLRKVMAKKKRELVGQERERFVAGCVQQGISERLAADLFDLIEPFADYGFPAAHACAYGFIAYQTAYLIAQHPVEYMAAILTSVKDDKDRKPYYLYACRGMKIEVLPPRRQRVRHGLRPSTRRSPSDPLRPVRGPQRRGRRRAGHPGRSPIGWILRVLRRPVPAGRPGGIDEARPRVAHLRGLGRLVRVHEGRGGAADRRAGGVGEGRGADPRRTQGSGRRPVLALRGGYGWRRTRRDRRGDPGRGRARQAAPALQRAGDARAVRA